MQPGKGSVAVTQVSQLCPYFLLVAKIKSSHVRLLLHLLGALQERRRH